MNKYLEQAIQTERFLAGTSEETPSGTTWRRTPEGKPTHSLYHGSAGVLLFYLELYNVTGEDNYLLIARNAGDDLVDYVARKAAAEDFITIGFYSGWPGYVFSLNELFNVCGDDKYRKAALIALARITAQASPQGTGIGWIEPIPFSDITGIEGEREVIDLSVGAAGTGIIYLYAHRQGLAEEALSLAIKTADRLIEVAEQTPDGLRWLMMVDMAFAFTAPNFAHGGAGVAYFLADLYRETGNDTYLQAAISGARYVQSRTHAQAEGFLVCHTEEQLPASTFYLGVCHGPAGTGRLMYLLNQITGDNSWWDWLTENFKGLESTGAPEQRSKGLWQNLGQCCGDAGIGDYALFLYETSRDEKYLDYAKRTAEHMVKHANHENGLAWAQAEHRNRPEFTEIQTGYMQGAAGIGSFLLHLATVTTGHPRKIVMPETPFHYAPG